jgi:ABC-type Fe3+/spermidine/putrescine transport system ATPase subunit
VSLNVKSGEFATLLGPSGSGKTTALSLLSGIMQPTSGRMLIGGRDITDVPAAQRNIGLVFQSYALFPHMSVFENIAFPLRVRRLSQAEIRARVKQALALVRLEDLGGRRPHELSGGQQQRVALARAIVFKPDILLLDEPLAALDRKLREEVRTEIHQLQRRLGITTIMVTHDQDEALSMSDRVVVMNAGRVQQVDTPDNAYYRPNSRFVAGFLGLANFLDGEIDSSPAAAPSVWTAGNPSPWTRAARRLQAASAASSAPRTSSS